MGAPPCTAVTNVSSASNALPLRADVMHAPMSMQCSTASRSFPRGSDSVVVGAVEDMLKGLQSAWELQYNRLQRVCGGAGAPRNTSNRKVLNIGDGVLFIGEVNTQRRPHGEGALLLADGTQHVGRFMGGRADGAGFYLAPKGIVVHGSWKQNLRV